MKPFWENGKLIKIPRSILPNFFTVGNMFTGFMSVIFTIRDQDLKAAAWMIVLGAFLDAMDGKVARITNTSSKFGVEYDSLADVVTFGFAPSLLIYSFFFYQWHFVGIFISFFPLLFGSIRLARFNVQLSGFSKDFFNGLPTPAAAVSFASYILFKYEYFPEPELPKIILILTFLVSVLMVSNIRYELVPQLSFRESTTRQKFRTILYWSSFVLVLIFPQTLMFPFMIIYILAGIVRYANTTLRGVNPKNIEADEE